MNKKSGGHVCLVKNCKSKAWLCKNIKFFRVPKEETRARIWMLQCNRPDLCDMNPDALYKSYRVCSLHFDNRQYTNHLKTHLLPTAVPTIFIYSANSPTSTCTLSQTEPRRLLTKKMENTVAAVENINNKNGEIEDEFDSCTDDKVCLYETVISGGYIKQEPYDTEDEPGNIHNYVDIKDNKVSVYDTVINGGYVKQDPCDTTDQPRNNHNYVIIKDEIIEDSTVVKQETRCTTNIKENYLTCCEECGGEYDLYCLKCPMLIRIFDGNNPDLSDNDVMRTLPKNFVDMYETQSGVGIVAVRVIPKGVVFGPFGGLDLTKDDALSKWVSRNKERVYATDPKCSNWMQYIRRVDRSSHPNLTPFQYEDELYYQSDCHISVGDELLVRCDSDREENTTLDSCFKPRICESLDDTYACTLCCVGYKSICHLLAHNSRCPRKRNQNDFCEEIIRCAFCKIHVNKKEYSDHHVDRCFEKNRKIFAMHQDDNDDKSFGCTQCPFKTKSKWRLKRHIVSHTDDKPFACSLCSYKTKTKSLLKQHMHRHTDDKQFACSLCSYKTIKNYQLKRHIATHTEDKPFACSLCSYKTKTKPLLKQHMFKHTDDKAFACSLCSYKSKTRSQLRHHMLSHEDDKPFGCTQCPFKTKSKWRLKLHIVTHNENKPFACSLCSYKTKTKSILKQHMFKHTDDKPFACSLCPFKTKTKLLLKQHMLKHTGDKPFTCSLCSYKTRTNYKLKLHIACHSDDKPFACTVCSFKTTTSTRLKAHVVIHTDDKPFACSICPYKTKTNYQLKLHIAIHNDDKPFSCSLCSFRAKTNSNLKLHLAIHKDEKAFACPFCSFKTTTSTRLKAHVLIHTDDKPFACSLCSYRTKTNHQLKLHIAIHNEDKPFACTVCSYKARTNYKLKLHIASHSDYKPFACTVCSFKARTNYKLKLHMTIHDDVTESLINQQKLLIASKK